MKPVLHILLTAAALALQGMAAEQNWNLVWSDEFDQAGAPDPARWTNEVGMIRNREAQYYAAGRSENIRVENGRLVIEARKEKFPNPGFDPARTNDWRRQEFAQFTSGSLTTKGKFQPRYGRIEVRAKLPSARGVWPAIWMLGTNITEVGWPRCGEIDIMEFVGYDPGAIHANIHTARYNHTRGTGKGNQIKVERPFDDFHVYAADWHPDRIDFYFDGKKYFTYEKEANAGADTWPFDQPHYLILNFAVGGAWGGRKGIDEAAFPQKFEIDYVRIYEAAKE
jgi:beta-glucanase (GH16 family)